MDQAPFILPNPKIMPPVGRLHHLIDIIRQQQQGPASRATRVLLLVIAIWILSVFDLTFTLFATRIGGFHELNPVARLFIGNGQALILYKIGVTLAGTAVLLAFRRRRLTEIGCWLLFIAQAVLAGIWAAYFAYL